MCENDRDKTETEEKREGQRTSDDKTPVEIPTWWNGEPITFTSIMGM